MGSPGVQSEIKHNLMLLPIDLGEHGEEQLIIHVGNG